MAKYSKFQYFTHLLSSTPHLESILNNVCMFYHKSNIKKNYIIVYTSIKMVRASSKQSTATSPAVVVPPVSPVPSDVKKVYKKAAAKSAPVEVAVTKDVPPPSVVTSTDAPVSEGLPVDDLIELLNSFSSKVNELSVFYATIKSQYKLLQKVVLKEHKTAQKVSNRKNKRSGNRKPSGFVRPCLVSDELAAFLGKASGTEMARTEVSKEINNYIRNHKLQDAKNGRQINADGKLTALLKLQPGDSLTYFNLQRYMKHHFLKATPPTTA